MLGRHTVRRTSWHAVTQAQRNCEFVGEQLFYTLNASHNSAAHRGTAHRSGAVEGVITSCLSLLCRPTCTGCHENISEFASCLHRGILAAWHAGTATSVGGKEVCVMGK